MEGNKCEDGIKVRLREEMGGVIRNEKEYVEVERGEWKRANREKTKYVRKVDGRKETRTRGQREVLQARGGETKVRSLINKIKKAEKHQRN